MVVPVLNRDEALRRAVASVIPQSPEISVVIVDDGSARDFAAVADELATSEARVKALHQTNSGPAAARNTGLRATASPFVMFLDSDDELAGRAFDAIQRELLSRDDVGMVCGAVQVVSADGAVRTDHPVILPGVEWTKLSWVGGSFAVRTEIARAVGGYDEALAFGENTDFILRIAEECRQRSLSVRVTADVLCVYNQEPQERRYDEKRLGAALHLLERGRVDLRLPSERARLHSIAAVNAARIGRYGVSVKHAALAVMTEPRNSRHVGRLVVALTGPLARWRWRRM